MESNKTTATTFFIYEIFFSFLSLFIEDVDVDLAVLALPNSSLSIVSIGESKASVVGIATRMVSPIFPIIFR